MDEVVRRPEKKMARMTEMFHETDGVIQSTSIKTVDADFRRPAVKLTPIF